ncbi:MAG: SET domain-containing protein-lysine N-methyltransferase [Verrucomicrobia bacterium]|nr:SET domain-containing protein-lysine N-methyltransferase [Verrucomicrobiota bacterium]
MKTIEFENRFGLRYLSKLAFQDVAIEKQVKDKCEKTLKRKDYQTENRWHTSLFQREIEREVEIPFEIKEVHPLIGYGVFAIKKIPFLTFLGEYTGLIRKRNRRIDKSNDYVFGYSIGPKDTKWVIDASEQGNFTRFINHSDEPNLTSTWIVLDGLSHIIFFANRLILPGEQLTYDYGPYYWRKRAAPLDL